MKIGFRANFQDTGEFHFEPVQYQTTLADISGREVWIRLLKSPLSEKLHSGMPLTVDLPDQEVIVIIRDIDAEAGWLNLHCRSKNVFPAIVIGRNSMSQATK